MWYMPDDEPQNNDSDPQQPQPQQPQPQQPQMDLVVDLLFAVVPHTTMFTSLTNVSKTCAQQARENFDAFLTALARTSNRLGMASVQRTREYWGDDWQYGVTSKPTNKWSFESHVVNYDYAEHEHGRFRGARPGVGSILDYDDICPTRDQTFATNVTKNEFLRAAFGTYTPNMEPRQGAGRRNHAMCEPLFVHRRINFFKRMAIPNHVLYEIVMLGSRGSFKGNKHQRFLVGRLLEHR